jgi:hypothetical protein
VLYFSFLCRGRTPALQNIRIVSGGSAPPPAPRHLALFAFRSLKRAYVKVRPISSVLAYRRNQVFSKKKTYSTLRTLQSKYKTKRGGAGARAHEVNRV